VDGEDLVGCCPRLDLLLAALLCLAEPLGHVTTSWPSPPPTDDSSNSSRGVQVAAAECSSSGGAAAGSSGTTGSGTTRLTAAAVQPEQHGLGSWHWWCMRALLLQQQVLSGQSATLRRALQQQMAATRQHLEQLQQHAAAPGSGQQPLTSQQVQLLAVLLELEAAAVHRQYGYVREAAASLEAAAAAAGVQVGDLGGGQGATMAWEGGGYKLHQCMVWWRAVSCYCCTAKRHVCCTVPEGLEGVCPTPFPVNSPTPR
jgi:hypothetical protein